MRRRKPLEFWEVLVSLRAGASWELLAAFCLGILIVAILSNLAYDVLKEGRALDTAAWGRMAVALVVLTALAYGLYWRDSRRVRRVTVEVDESRLAPPHRGLIWLLGPGRPDHLFAAIGHHRRQPEGEPRLAHCWLVFQRADLRVNQAYHAVVEWAAGEARGLNLYPLPIERTDVQSTYRAVTRVFEREAREVGLLPEEIVADVTGGTKPMTAGMVLACLGAERHLEYVESDRDDEGYPIEGSQRVVLIRRDFVLERSAPGNRVTG